MRRRRGRVIDEGQDVVVPPLFLGTVGVVGVGGRASGKMSVCQQEAEYSSWGPEKDQRRSREGPQVELTGPSARASGHHS